jgi:opacity protein-like surface antigen
MGRRLPVGPGARRTAPGQLLVAGLTLLLPLVAARHAEAQAGGDGFLFRQPSGAVVIRGGFDFASAGSDVFDFITEHLTVDHRDFSGPSFVFDVTYKLSPRFDVVFGLATSGSTTHSEFRHFIDNNDLPIEQTTSFHRVPLTASLRVYLTPPGRAVGRYAWVPRRVAPYVGGGGGAMWYRLRQEGSFVDFDTLSVFDARLESDGWAPTLQGFAGTEISLSPRFAVSVEGRYQWAHADLSADYSGFDRIDLSGFSLTAGIAIRY